MGLTESLLSMLIPEDSGGRYQDRTFHYILDNYIPIYTHTIDNTYTLKIGLCMMYDGNDIKGYLPPMEGYIDEVGSAEYDRQENINMYIIAPRTHLIAVQVMYKNNVPIYAGNVYKLGEFYPDWAGWNTDSFSSAFFYQSRGDFKLDSATLSSCTYFELTHGSSGYDRSDHFYTDLSFSWTYSYQNYTTQQTYSPPQVFVVKDGGRSTGTGTYSFSSIYVISYYGTYTDMTVGEFWDEMQNIYRATKIAEGRQAVPLVIKYPID